MKLGICAYPLSKGKETGRGLDRVVDEYCTYLEKNNIEFDFYERGLDRNLKGSASTKEEFKTIAFTVSKFFTFRKAQNWCYFGTYPVASFLPILASKKPLVTAVHDLIPFFVHGYDKGIKYAFKRWCIKKSCINSDHLIVPFSSTREKIIEMFGVEADKISVIPYGVSHETYYLDNKVKKIKNQIAFLGEAKRAKGMDSVIKAFKYVLNEVPDAKLVLASQGNELEIMTRLAKEMLPDNSYSFAGFISENKMREFYSSMDLFCFPSRYGFGLSALEAMACGTPAIVGSTLDALDFIKDSDLLVDPENEKELARKIIKLLQNRELHKNKCDEAIKIASHYSWEKMSAAYYEVCCKFLNRG